MSSWSFFFIWFVCLLGFLLLLFFGGRFRGLSFQRGVVLVVVVVVCLFVFVFFAFVVVVNMTL